MEANVKVLARIAVVAATLAALAAGAPAAGADTTWTKISTDYNANIVVPSLGLTGTTAVVAWTQQTGPCTADHRHGQLHDLADAGRDRRRGHARPRWAGRQLDYTHALFPPPGGGLAAGVLRHPLDHHGRPADRGAHDAPQRRRQLGPAVRRLGLELRADHRRALGRHAVRRRATPRRASRSSTRPSAHAPGASDQNLQPQLGGCCGYVPKMALDSAGHLWIAWYSNATGATGVYVQQLDPVDGRADRRRPRWRPTARAPTTTASARRWPAQPPAASSTATRRRPARPTPIVSWWPGQAAPTTIANLAGTGQGAGRVLTAAYRADGRLWVAWFDGKTYRATLGDATGRRRRGAGCGRAQGLRGGRLRALEHGRRRQPAAGRELRAGTRPGRCRSRSS